MFDAGTSTLDTIAVQVVTPLLVVVLLAPVAGASEACCPCEGLERAQSCRDRDAELSLADACAADRNEGGEESCPRDCERCACCSAVGPFVSAEAVAIAPAITMHDEPVDEAPASVPSAERHGVFRPPRG